MVYFELIFLHIGDFRPNHQEDFMEELEDWKGLLLDKKKRQLKIRIF